MRRSLGWSVIIILALTTFYLAWPAWTGRQIAVAINASDPAALESRIDFPSVRNRARPVVQAEMERRLDQLKREAGPLGAAIAGQLSQGFGGKLVDSAVDQLLTPQSLIEIVHQGRDFRRAWRRVANPQAKSASTDPAAGQPQVGAEHRRLGLANVKSYRLTGPLGIAVGLARDPAATQADAVVEMTFTGGGWKVTGILPQL